jgi:chromosome segregation ATPase
VQALEQEQRASAAERDVLEERNAVLAEALEDLKEELSQSLASKAALQHRTGSLERKQEDMQAEVHVRFLMCRGYACC